MKKNTHLFGDCTFYSPLRSSFLQRQTWLNQQDVTTSLSYVPNMCRDTFYLAGKSEIRYITSPIGIYDLHHVTFRLVTSAIILFAASYIRYKLLVSYLGLILAGTSFYDLLGLNLTSKSTFSKRKHGTFFFLSGRLWKLAY